MRCFRILAEHLVEAATAREEMKRLVENDEWFGEGIHYRKRKGLGLCTIVKLSHLVVLLCAGASHDFSHRRACDAGDGQPYIVEAWSNEHK